MMKKAGALILAVLLAMGLCACTRKHYDETNISELYDRDRIIGKTSDDIQKRYGEFDRDYVADNGLHYGVYYVNYENYGFDPSYIHDSYYIVFDDQNVAVDADFSRSSRGG